MPTLKISARAGHIGVRPPSKPPSERTLRVEAAEDKWVQTDKAELAMQAEPRMYLVQALHELVPRHGAKGRRHAQRASGDGTFRRMDGTFPGHLYAKSRPPLDMGPWAVKFEQILAERGVSSTPPLL